MKNKECGARLFSDIGERVGTDQPFGISKAGHHNLNFDSTDCVAAIEACGDDVFELLFHTNDGISVRVLGDVENFRKLGEVLRSLGEK